MKRRSERRKIVGAYVRERLRSECTVRGAAANIARATGFSTAHVTNVQKQDRGVGDDFAEAIARYWGMTYAQLEEEAQRWWAERQPTPQEVEADPSPNRSRAAQLAREDRVSEMAIQSVLAEPITPENGAQSALWWAIRMKLREHEMLKQQLCDTPKQ